MKQNVLEQVWGGDAACVVSRQTGVGKAPLCVNWSINQASTPTDGVRGWRCSKLWLSPLGWLSPPHQSRQSGVAKLGSKMRDTLCLWLQVKTAARAAIPLLSADLFQVTLTLNSAEVEGLQVALPLQDCFNWTWLICKKEWDKSGWQEQIHAWAVAYCVFGTCMWVSSQLIVDAWMPARARVWNCSFAAV